MKTLIPLVVFASSLFLLAACNDKQAETSTAVAEDNAPASETVKNTEAATSATSEEAPVTETPAENSAQGTEAAQLAYGHELHEEHCARCHEPEFYMKEDRKVQDRAKLDSMVRACDAQLGTSLFDEDMEILANYLDKKYYRFSE